MICTLLTPAASVCTILLCTTSLKLHKPAFSSPKGASSFVPQSLFTCCLHSNLCQFSHCWFNFTLLPNYSLRASSSEAYLTPDWLSIFQFSFIVLITTINELAVTLLGAFWMIPLWPLGMLVETLGTHHVPLCSYLIALLLACMMNHCRVITLKHTLTSALHECPI